MNSPASRKRRTQRRPRPRTAAAPSTPPGPPTPRASSTRPGGTAARPRPANRGPVAYQRNALAPALIASAALFAGVALVDNEFFIAVRLLASILGLIVAWFAVPARQWWWPPVFVAIAVIWNPVFPFDFEGPLWTAAQAVAAVVFFVAGALIKVERTDDRRPAGRGATERRR